MMEWLTVKEEIKAQLDLKHSPSGQQSGAEFGCFAGSLETVLLLRFHICK